MTRRGFFTRLAAVPLVVFVGRKIGLSHVETVTPMPFTARSLESVLPIPQRFLYSRVKISPDVIAASRTSSGAFAAMARADRASLEEEIARERARWRR